MASSTLSQLPGEHSRRFIVPEAVILSWSETQKERKDATGQDGAGRRLGYWRVLRRDAQSGNIPIPDERLNPLLQKITGEEFPSYVPCSVVGNPIPDPSRPGMNTLDNSIMFRRFAWYAKNAPYCACGQEDAVDRQAERAVQETANEGGRQFKRIVAHKPYPCRGEDCPDYLAERCKLQVIVSVRLPWAGGIVAKYRTTGKASFAAMMASLLDIHAMAGWLHGMGLELVYAETKAREKRIPQIRFQPDRHIADRLLLAGRETSQLYGDTTRIAQLVEQSRTDMVAFVEDPVEQRQFRQEFHPHNESLPIIEGQVEPMAEAAETPPRRGIVVGTGPVAECPAEDFNLQPPPDPVKPSQVTDAATFEAAMGTIGKGDRATIVEYRVALGVDKQSMNAASFRAVYTKALSDWEEAHAE